MDLEPKAGNAATNDWPIWSTSICYLKGNRIAILNNFRLHDEDEVQENVVAK